MFALKVKQCYIPKTLLNMVKNVIRTIRRKIKHIFIKCLARCKWLLLLPPLALFLLLFGPLIWRCLMSIIDVFDYSNIEPSLQKTMNRDLQHYLQNIEVIIEPVRSICKHDVPVVALVSSSWTRLDYRDTVRLTWGQFQPTLFVLGRNEGEPNLLGNMRGEAEAFDDLLVFDFPDTVPNQTLKTALMMRWTLHQCPQAQFMLKTYDDMMMNPWMLHNVLRENHNAALIGYNFNNSRALISRYKRGHMPRVLRDDKDLNYLSNTGYLVRGDYIEAILEKAYEVPLMALEDVYFTYYIAQKYLGLKIAHDRRMTPFRPWVKIDCIYWKLVFIHMPVVDDMILVWSDIERLVATYRDITDLCKHFDAYFFWVTDLLLY